MSLLTGNAIASLGTPEAFVVGQTPTTQVGFEKVAGQTGIFVFAKDKYKIYFKNTAGQWVQHADITQVPVVNKGLTYPWGDYTAVCFAAINPKLEIHVHVKTSNILVDNTPNDPNDDDFTLYSPSGATSYQSDAYDLPDVDGTNGQVLTTDGGGNVTWETIVHPTELPASPNEGELLVAGTGGSLSWEGPLVTKMRLPYEFTLIPRVIYADPAQGLLGADNRATFGATNDGFIRPTQVLFERTVFDTMKDKYGPNYGESSGEFNAPLDGYYQINLHMRWHFGTLGYHDDNRIDTFIAVSDKPRHLYLANGEDAATAEQWEYAWDPDSTVALHEPNVSPMACVFQDSFEIPYEFGGDTAAEDGFDHSPSVSAVEMLCRNLHTTIYLKKNQKVRTFVRINNETTLPPGSTRHKLSSGWYQGMPGGDNARSAKDFLPTELTIRKL